MKTMSQVAHLRDCPETLDEARELIDQQQVQIRAPREEMKELRADLSRAHDGLDEQDQLREVCLRYSDVLTNTVETLAWELYCAATRESVAKTDDWPGADTRREFIEAARQRVKELFP